METPLPNQRGKMPSGKYFCLNKYVILSLSFKLNFYRRVLGVLVFNLHSALYIIAMFEGSSYVHFVKTRLHFGTKQLTNLDCL